MNEFVGIETSEEAKRVAMACFASDCFSKGAWFYYDDASCTIGWNKAQREHYQEIRPQIQELKAVEAILSHIERHTWIYVLGMNMRGQIVETNCDRLIERLGHVSAVRILARFTGSTEWETAEPCQLISEIISSDLVSHFEIGILEVTAPNHITGQTEEGRILDVAGRQAFIKEFGLHKYAEKLREQMVACLDVVRSHDE